MIHFYRIGKMPSNANEYFYNMHSELFRRLVLPVILMGIAMVFLRNLYSGTQSYLFLLYNLFLGSISLFMSYWIQQLVVTKVRWFALLIPLCIWLLFLPNAPYLVTDLLHLSESHHRMVWFDTLMILCFAITGLFLGIYPVKMLADLVAEKWGPFKATYFVTFSLLSAAFGMYLGRYHRFNSWDLIQHPLSLISAIADRFMHPAQHPRTWGMTLMFGVFLHIVYYAFKPLKAPKALQELH